MMTPVGIILIYSYFAFFLFFFYFLKGSWIREVAPAKESINFFQVFWFMDLNHILSPFSLKIVFMKIIYG